MLKDIIIFILVLILSIENEFFLLLKINKTFFENLFYLYFILFYPFCYIIIINI